MNYCNKCRVHVNTKKSTCPLCFASLEKPNEVISAENSNVEYEHDIEKYPPANDVAAYRYNFALRFLLFTSIFIGSTALMVNWLTYNGRIWSIFVVAFILYLWASIAYPIFSKKSIGHIIVVEVLTTSLVLFLIQIYTNTKGWALDYMTPFLTIGSTLMITFVLLLKRMKWRQYAVYQLTTMLLGFIPLLFCVFGLVQTIWPSIVAAFYSFMTLIGMLVFADKKYENEIKKRLHF